MRRRFALVAAALACSLGLGAAPAPSSYQAVQKKIEFIRADWARPGRVADPNSPGWELLFQKLLDQLKSYGSGGFAEREAALARIGKIDAGLAGAGWAPGIQIHVALAEWLTPRQQLAVAERTLRVVVGGSGSTNPNQSGYRAGWVRYVEEDLGAALRDYDKANTVVGRQSALARVRNALAGLQRRNSTQPWPPALALQSALTQIYDRRNLDVAADLASVTPFLSANLVSTGPVARGGYVSQVTAGPKTGFGLLPSDDGIAFYNSQLLTSVTPITDFQRQLSQDEEGRRAAKLYHFNATSFDSPQLTVVAVLRASGVQLSPSSTHAIEAVICALPQPGKHIGQTVAGVIGLGPQEITQKVYDGAIAKIRSNVVQGSEDESRERVARESAQRNAQFSQFLVGNNTIALNNVAIRDVYMQSRPDQALIGGTIGWRQSDEPFGADAPQPPEFASSTQGVSADVHLNSILTGLADGYLSSEALRSVENILIETKAVPPGTPPAQAFTTTLNVDDAAFVEAANRAKAANNPKVLAVRVFKPSRPPVFASDANGNLVALINDFQVDVPAGGGKLYRIKAPQVEIVASMTVAPASASSPSPVVTLKLVDLSFGSRAKVEQFSDVPGQPPRPNPFGTIALGFVQGAVRGKSFDAPLSSLPLRGFALTSISALDPSGWIRVVLTPTAR